MEYTQDMVNQIDNEISEGLKAGKDIDQIEKDIATKISEMKPVEIKYSAGKEIVKIIQKAEKLKSKLEADKSKIII